MRAQSTQPPKTLDQSFEPPQLAGTHHARYIDPTTPLHIISRVFQGRHILRPTPELTSLIIGVIGRAQHVYGEVSLYAFAFMSNHMHLMLRGPANQVPAFIGFIKREISRRWGGRPEIDWPGPMWHQYLATALPTPDSQVACLKYILGQGVNEGLVARPQDWPGAHCARHLLGRTSTGEWLDATSYSRARDAEARKRKPARLNKQDYMTTYAVALQPIPPWEGLTSLDRLRAVEHLVAAIEEEGRTERSGRRPLGAHQVRRVPLEHRTAMPRQPWFERRRRMICWANPGQVETREYLDRYWAFQRQRRDALCGRSIRRILSTHSCQEPSTQAPVELPHKANAPSRWRPGSFEGTLAAARHRALSIGPNLAFAFATGHSHVTRNVGWAWPSATARGRSQEGSWSIACAPVRHERSWSIEPRTFLVDRALRTPDTAAAPSGRASA